jgi:3-hydroxy-5-methyl-1-naphthoate 3-O-methyltransferase
MNQKTTTRVPTCDERPIFDLFAAQMQSRVTEIALRIGLFEVLREPCRVSSLCEMVRIGRRAADALLAVLASCELVELTGSFIHLTDIAREYLLVDSPFFKGHLFHTINDNELDLLRNVHLQDHFMRPTTRQWLGGRVLNPDRQAEIMHAHTFAAATAFARERIFCHARSLLDVAGGSGSFSIALTAMNSELRCTIMDLPEMEPAARSVINRFAAGDVVTFKGLEMFSNEWPANFDAVLLSNVLHDWSHQRCALLVAKAYQAVQPGGRVFINEMLLQEDGLGPRGTALFSVMMLLQTEGRQFTFSELSSLLQSSGFVEVTTVSVFGYYSLISARRPILP